MTKTLFECEACGAQFPRWQGQCSGCQKWNTLTESTMPIPGHVSPSPPEEPVQLSEYRQANASAITVGIPEFDRVLGRGLVDGSVVLLGGEPGIGKSTLAVQIAQAVAKSSHVFYVSCEESVDQVFVRAQRLGESPESLFVVAETDLMAIMRLLDIHKPDVVILDSVQMVAHQEVGSSAGSVAQVRHCANMLIGWVKQNRKACVLIGHITKEGSLAGPKVLEHMVDIILYLEGERDQSFRILRCFKNRYASTQEIGIFKMDQKGLCAVQNTADVFVDGLSLASSGSIIVPVVQGSRVILVEVQALTVNSGYGMAKRTFVGIDPNRANILIAALEKSVGLRLSSKDIFINLIGGLKIREPALDLGVALAIVSSLYDHPMGRRLGVFGEVGLAGEIRPVPEADKRFRELEKLGFQDCICPKKNEPKEKSGLQLRPCQNLKEAIAGFGRKPVSPPDEKEKIGSY